MPVDRRIFKIPFYKGSLPEWKCPTCNKGILKGREGSFRYSESKNSLDSQKRENWDPEFTDYVYSCEFICTNPNCKDIVANIGVGSLEMEPTFDPHGNVGGVQYFPSFLPKYFCPHLNIFEISENTPIDVKMSIEESFKLFFVSHSASSGCLRIALERLLDNLKVKKFENKKNKRIQISLHRRIESLPKKFLRFKDLFFAIKWLGNAGSHHHKITIDDVMDAYDIFEEILNELFDHKTEKIRKMVKQVNQRKGPGKNKKHGEINDEED